MLLLVFTFFELLGDIVRNSVPLVLVGEYLLNVTPYSSTRSLPLSVLLAVLVTFGLMQKSNEITAMKATGISVYRIIFPVLVIAAVLAAGLFFFDQLYLPHANKRQDALRNQIKGKPAQTYLRPDRKWIFGQHSDIYYYEFYDPDQNRFGSISVFQFDPKTFQLTQAHLRRRARTGPTTLQKWVFEQGWARTFSGSAIEDYQHLRRRAPSRSCDGTAGLLQEGSEAVVGDELRGTGHYIHDLQQSGFDVVRLRVQLQKKFAYP